MPDNGDISRSLGRIEGKVTAIHDDVRTLKETSVKTTDCEKRHKRISTEIHRLYQPDNTNPRIEIDSPSADSWKWASKRLGVILQVIALLALLFGVWYTVKSTADDTRVYQKRLERKLERMEKSR